jgi:glycosyltransferase involved in cell wall biosynthesis
MRVCVITFKYCWRDGNGTWLSDGGFPLQMAGMRSLFDEMTLIIPEGSQRQGGIPLPRDATIVPIRVPKGHGFAHKLSFVANLRSYIRTMIPHVHCSDVIHLPVPGDISFLGMSLALVLRKRMIVRYGSSWAQTPQATVATTLTKAMMRWFAGGRNVMMATGDGPAPPAEGIYWIFSTAITDRELRMIPFQADRGLNNPLKAAYIGRLSAEKGVNKLIEAVILLVREGVRPVPHFTIIGDGPDRKALEIQITNAGLRDQFFFTGQLDRDALSKALQQIDFCVQPSLTEGFSKAWLDAFAHGLPVLTSNVGAAGSVIGGNGERGWLVPPGDVQMLKERMHRIVTESLDWPGIRQRCRDFTERRTLEVWADEIGRICARQWDIRFEHGKLRA